MDILDIFLDILLKPPSAPYGAIFSHLVLLFLQKCFLYVKLQYLVSTYL